MSTDELTIFEDCLVITTSQTAQNELSKHLHTHIITMCTVIQYALRYDRVEVLPSKQTSAPLKCKLGRMVQIKRKMGFYCILPGRRPILVPYLGF